MIDPFALKNRSKLDPYRLGWTLYGRAMDSVGRLRYRTFSPERDLPRLDHTIAQRGDAMEDTAVTTGQAELLDLAVRETEGLTGALLELGCYRGATTERFAAATGRTVYAVDPYIGYGGWEADMAKMQARTQNFPNVRHLRLASGAAAAQLTGEPLALVFIDAVHDFVNTTFDFECWSAAVVPGGLVAFHDVDDFPGTNLALRRILARRQDFRPWGHCPNLVILQRKVDPTEPPPPR